MKKKIALTVAVLMVVGIVALAGSSFADSHILEITAYINREIKMTWDGQAFEPKDDGERLYPIVYNGRTYLPAKFVADKAGVDVDWDDDTKTVIFKNRIIDIDLTTPYKDAENYTDSTSSNALANLPFTKFDLEIEGYDDDYELEVEFELYSNGWYKAEVEIELDDSDEVELTGRKALNYLLPIFSNMNLKANMSQEEIITAVIDAFDWDYDYEEFELEVYFGNGARIDIDIED